MTDPGPTFRDLADQCAPDLVRLMGNRSEPPSALIGLVVEDPDDGSLDMAVIPRTEILEASLSDLVDKAARQKDDDRWLRVVFLVEEGCVSTRLFLYEMQAGGEA